MKKRHFNIILAIFSFWSYSAYSQIDCEKNPPLPPVMTSVSVQPETGKTELKWTLSPSPDIAAYVLFSYKDGAGMPIDTLWNPFATNYVFNSTATKYFSVSYVVQAIRIPICKSPFSNALTTLFAEASIDTCNKKIMVTWNTYSSFPNKVNGYTILASVNGGNYTEAAIVSSDKNSSVLIDFVTNTEYCFFVKANLEGGLSSTSNKACLLTRMQRAPGWINADYATVNSGNKISLSFSIDPLSEITDFNLERKTGQSGIFQEIDKLVSSDKSVLFTDGQADVTTVNYYRLSAINSCDIPITVSNLSSNMVLTLEIKGKDLELSWNSYKEWLGTITSYRLFINTGAGFEEKAVIPATDSVFTLGYQELMYDVSGNEICFYISASETSNPYGVNGQSNSSGICISPIEIITVPNVFTPNNDNVNDLFRPVLSFTPHDYHLVISDRHGSILFETRDYLVEWDGSHNENPYPQGVCLWFLKVTTPSGKNISKTGTLTVIRDR